MKNCIAIVFALFTFYPNTYFGQNEINLREFKAEIVMVRTFEVLAGTFWSSKLSISDGTGEIWSIDLRSTRPKNIDENLTTITRILNLVKEQGYSLTMSNSAGANEHGVFISNYIFERKK